MNKFTETKYLKNLNMIADSYNRITGAINILYVLVCLCLLVFMCMGIFLLLLNK